MVGDTSANGGAIGVSGRNGGAMVGDMSTNGSAVVVSGTDMGTTVDVKNLTNRSKWDLAHDPGPLSPLHHSSQITQGIIIQQTASYAHHGTICRQAERLSHVVEIPHPTLQDITVDPFSTYHSSSLYHTRQPPVTQPQLRVNPNWYSTYPLMGVSSWWGYRSRYSSPVLYPGPLQPHFVIRPYFSFFYYLWHFIYMQIGSYFWYWSTFFFPHLYATPYAYLSFNLVILSLLRYLFLSLPLHNYVFAKPLATFLISFFSIQSFSCVFVLSWWGCVEVSGHHDHSRDHSRTLSMFHSHYFTSVVYHLHWHWGVSLFLFLLILSYLLST